MWDENLVQLTQNGGLFNPVWAVPDIAVVLQPSEGMLMAYGNKLPHICCECTTVRIDC